MCCGTAKSPCIESEVNPMVAENIATGFAVQYEAGTSVSVDQKIPPHTPR